MVFGAVGGSPAAPAREALRRTPKSLRLLVEGLLQVEREGLIAFGPVEHDLNRGLLLAPLELIDHGRRELRVGEGLPVEFNASTAPNDLDTARRPSFGKNSSSALHLPFHRNDRAVCETSRFPY